MAFKVRIAKSIMNCVPSKPFFDITQPRSENINHISFIKSSEKEKSEILYEMARCHYQEDQIKPFDHYFPNISLETLLNGKDVLDLGCWCGGKSVSCAERWSVKSMHGIDINEYFIDAAKLFSSNRGKNKIQYSFRVGVGENLPYEDASFDAIISWDVFEHVRSLKENIAECKRVLKPKGMLFSVFPSYYEPFGGSHLDHVTKMPMMQWFFDPDTLNTAYEDIIRSRGDEAYWYRCDDNANNQWQKLRAGIGINGTTFCEYESIVREIGFSKICILPTPLFSVGITAIRYPRTKIFSRLFSPFIGNLFLRDYLSNRIVSILVA